MRLRVGIDWRPVRRPTYSALVVSGVAPSSTARCTFSPVASYSRTMCGSAVSRRRSDSGESSPSSHSRAPIV